MHKIIFLRTDGIPTSYLYVMLKWPYFFKYILPKWRKTLLSKNLPMISSELPQPNILKQIISQEEGSGNIEVLYYPMQ
uniref:CRAL-TRIO domain-containing protein n=1 Tax=Steinernema glaseri TaxID=37863 RepID=A0A1I7YN90_9BILA